ncbi:hypothetical protein CVM73_24485 [Bradyrhizobium forestalis]|uniref:Uncharacterized protein n=1 Tax=Bradyrhizobium forestalis TaxID=1419263 RepID=A0A2M8R4P7_9BRAD|nr:hypothetical protein CVM73_24485 [Bradyrhizobium forestalis]
MTAIDRHHRSAAKTDLSTSRPTPEVVQKKPEIEPHSRTRHCAKLSQAGEGRGEGVSAMGHSPRGQSPHPALRHSRGFASAFLKMTAAGGGLRLSRKRER